MPPEVRDRVFEPFFTTKGRDGDRPGVGNRRRHRHPGGWRDRRRECGGCGVDIHRVLPQTNAAEVSAPPPAAPADLRGTERILLVEETTRYVRCLRESCASKVTPSSKQLPPVRQRRGRRDAAIVRAVVERVVLPDGSGAAGRGTPVRTASRSSRAVYVRLHRERRAERIVGAGAAAREAVPSGCAAATCACGARRRAGYSR